MYIVTVSFLNTSYCDKSLVLFRKCKRILLSRKILKWKFIFLVCCDMQNISFILEQWHVFSVITHDYIVHFTYFFIVIFLFSLKHIFLRWVYFLLEFDQYVEVQIFLKNISWFIYNCLYLFFIHSMNITFRSLDSFIYFLV